MSEWPAAPAGDGRDLDAFADAEVIARVLDGDVNSFGVLVGRYQAALYRYAAAMVLDHDAAADLVQDAFVRTYVSLRRCRDPRAFRAWILKTLRHRCLDYLKEARRRDVRIGDGDEYVDSSEPPDTRLVRRELRAGIRHALDRLPDAQREAFLLHVVEGVPYEVMADVVGASVSALKMRVLRAREALVRALASGDVTDVPLDRLYSRSG